MVLLILSLNANYSNIIDKYQVFVTISNNNYA
jgi:hypothetical protein